MKTKPIDWFLPEIPSEIVSGWEAKNLAGKTLAGLKRQNAKARLMQNLCTCALWLCVLIAAVIALSYVATDVYNHLAGRRNSIAVLVEALIVMTVLIALAVWSDKGYGCYYRLANIYENVVEHFRGDLLRLDPNGQRWIIGKRLTREAVKDRLVCLTWDLCEAVASLETIRFDGRCGFSDLAPAVAHFQEFYWQVEGIWQALASCNNVYGLERDEIDVLVFERPPMFAPRVAPRVV